MGESSGERGNKRLMSTLQDQVERLGNRHGMSPVEFASFDYASLFEGEEFPVCYDVSVYFSEAVPSREIRCGGLRLLGVGDITEESVNLLPGYLVAELGFIPIGASSGGDVYALDCTSGKVYELSHDKYNESSISPGWKPDFSGFLPDLPITRENVISTADRSFEDVGEFLDFLNQQDAT